MREARERELSRVMEKGYDINHDLTSKCAYYPIFRFCKFISKETGELVQGQQLVCAKCGINNPNKRCKHSHILLW